VFCDRCLPWPAPEEKAPPPSQRRAAEGVAARKSAAVAAAQKKASPAAAKVAKKAATSKGGMRKAAATKPQQPLACCCGVHHLSAFPKYWCEEEKRAHNLHYAPELKTGSGVVSFKADPTACQALESYLQENWKNCNGLRVWLDGAQGKDLHYLTGYNEYHVTPGFKAEVQKRNTLLATDPESFFKFYAADGARQLEKSVRETLHLEHNELIAVHILRQASHLVSGTGFADHKDDEENDRKVRSPTISTTFPPETAMSVRTETAPLFCAFACR
jgi:hypothetical protein